MDDSGVWCVGDFLCSEKGLSNSALHSQRALAYPTSCPGVPSSMLAPQNAWSDERAFDETRTRLARMFRDNFERYSTEPSAREVAFAAVLGISNNNRIAVSSASVTLLRVGRVVRW